MASMMALSSFFDVGGPVVSSAFRTSSSVIHRCSKSLCSIWTLRELVVDGTRIQRELAFVLGCSRMFRSKSRWHRRGLEPQERRRGYPRASQRFLQLWRRPFREAWLRGSLCKPPIQLRTLYSNEMSLFHRLPSMRRQCRRILVAIDG